MVEHDSNACVLKGVYKTVNGDIEILKGVDLELKSGTVTALLGPNGAGKTSTIRVILGLLKPTHGSVRVFDFDVTKEAEKIRGRIGLLPQTNSGYKSLTGIQNINFLLELTGKNIEKCQVQLEELLDRLDLARVALQPWSVLSGGEQRALGFIRAILSGDELLLLDEPTTGLDLARAAIIRKIIQEQVKEGKTVLMSSHVLTDLEELANQIVIIKNGRIMKSGTKKEIQEHYSVGGDLEDAIVAAFLEKNPEGI
ncbi:MAG: ABC transporter ATP-binding protein [Candidatus Kariarchaeaceae archaeon]|jgi:ABC-type multidrug transport system ATPase subunit